MTYKEKRVCINLCRAFKIDRHSKPYPSFDCNYLHYLRDRLIMLYDDDIIFYLPRILLELIINSDKTDIDEAFKWLNVRCGEYFEEYIADYRHRKINEDIAHWYSFQHKKEELYKDFSPEQCAAIRDWMEVADNYEELSILARDDEIIDAYLYWDERSKPEK